MTEQRNVGREIGLSLLAAVVLGAGLYWYIRSSIEMPVPPRLVETASAGGSAGAGGEARSSLDAANELAARFALDAFSAKCRASPFLSTLTRAVITKTQRRMVEGSSDATYTLAGMGMLVTGSGSLDASFTFLVDAGRMHILVLSIAGVPVLDGISGAR
jgi:hypothetical protein